jgi:hypothetical protein
LTGRRKEGRFFFFEKKKQKTFASLRVATALIICRVGCERQARVFWFFFSKKNYFLRNIDYLPRKIRTVLLG